MGRNHRGAIEQRSPAADLTKVPLVVGFDGTRVSVLGEADRRQLAQICEIVHVKPGATIYRQGDEAASVYRLIRGTVKTSRRLGRTRRVLTAFLFPPDLFGLADAGCYLNGAVALSPVTAYRMPVGALERLLRRNAEIEYHFLCMACQALREAQRHAIALTRRSAASKVALFLDMIGHRQTESARAGEIRIVMRRSDIAGYTGLSVEAVSRALGALERGGVIALRNRHHVRIVDRERFDRLLSDG